MKIIKKITSIIKNYYNKIDGSKTTIGAIIMLTSNGLKVFFPELLTPDQYQYLDLLGATISGYGLAHKGIKYNKVVTQNKINNDKLNN
jgi:hypothetical protein